MQRSVLSARELSYSIAGRALPLLASEGRAPYFYVNHPSTLPTSATASRRATGSRGARTAAATRTPKATPKEERDYGVCDVCFMVRNASGKCGCDE